ncbi:MAG: peptidase family protein [Proteobacteria bacterium]|nr:peptidase family protein [Pseudomonadota bacterium]
MADSNEPQWERKVLERLASAALAEQKSRRRWGIFFKLLGFAYLTLVLLLLVDWGDSTDKLADGKKHTAVVELDGVISPDTQASAENITEALQKAFKDKTTQGVVLRINSPGGSPVQSGRINDEIGRLRAKYPSIPLYVVVEDMCASGGYYVAAAADQIYVDKASIVGSIGVLMDGFGFTGTMDKLGVERRLLTAGENKGFLDPFSPQDAKQLEHAKVLLEDVHKQFIEVVRKGRGKRLKETPELFSGLMWTGDQAVQLGLADGFGSVEYVAREVIKAEDIKDFTVKQSLADRLARQFGADVAESMAGAFARLRLR